MYGRFYWTTKHPHTLPINAISPGWVTWVSKGLFYLCKQYTFSLVNISNYSSQVLLWANYSRLAPGTQDIWGPQSFFSSRGWGSGAWWTLSLQRGTLYLIRPWMNFGKVEICLKFEILKKKSFYKGVGSGDWWTLSHQR